MSKLEVNQAYDEQELRLLVGAENLYLGGCLGAALFPRENAGPLIQLLVEDDENWFPKGFIFDVGWSVDLERAMKFMQSRADELK